MPTALAIVNRGAEIIGYKDPDEALNGNDASNFLGVLNAMVDAWALEKLYVYAASEIVQPVSGNPITIGPGAQINTARPIRIPTGGFFRNGSVDYGFQMITREQYEAWLVKSIATPWPRYAYYEATMPTASLFFYPMLSSSGELHLPIEQRITQFADLNTVYTLPPGYQNALQYSLAEELTPGRRAANPDVIRLAAKYRRAIESYTPGILTIPGLGTRTQDNILTGWET
jgi:hypothetical protein